MKEQTDHEVVYYYDLHPRDGRLWSTELDIWLVPDGPYLRLYDRDGQMRSLEKRQKPDEQTSSRRSCAHLASTPINFHKAEE